MKRAFASLAGIVGLAAVGRWLAKHKHSVTSPAEPLEPTSVDTAAVDDTALATAADPADELRRKLSVARAAEPQTPAAPAQPEETLEERRVRVHAKAREAIDSMASDSTGDGGASS